MTKVSAVVMVMVTSPEDGHHDKKLDNADNGGDCLCCLCRDWHVTVAFLVAGVQALMATLVMGRRSWLSSKSH